MFLRALLFIVEIICIGCKRFYISAAHLLENVVIVGEKDGRFSLTSTFSIAQLADCISDYPSIFLKVSLTLCFDSPLLVLCNLSE